MDVPYVFHAQTLNDNNMSKLECFIQVNYNLQQEILMKHPDFKTAQTTFEFLLGPVKIKDGLFMGDELAAKDIDFIISNKVTHIINTVSKAIPNLYERFGIQYLSVHWTQSQQNIFDKKNNAINAIFGFVEEAAEQGESCLIHSINGKSRACSVLIAYLMKKYQWSLNKCLEYVNSKKQSLQIRKGFMVQLQELEKRMKEQVTLSSSWNQIKTQEDLILSNTFYNSHKYQGQLVQTNVSAKSKKRISWVDKPITSGIKSSLNTATRFKETNSKLKSILKGEKDQEDVSEISNSGTADIVHVSMNNFMNGDKKVQGTVMMESTVPSNKTFNSRPFSSDTKERQREKRHQPKIHKLFAFDTSPAINAIYKNPYEAKILHKLGSNSKLPRKKDEPKNQVFANQRPQSANIAAERKKLRGVITMGIGLDQTSTLKDEISLQAKKRYPSSNPKEQGYRWAR